MVKIKLTFVDEDIFFTDKIVVENNEEYQKLNKFINKILSIENYEKIISIHYENENILAGIYTNSTFYILSCDFVYIKIKVIFCDDEYKLNYETDDNIEESIIEDILEYCEYFLNEYDGTDKNIVSAKEFENNSDDDSDDEISDIREAMDFAKSMELSNSFAGLSLSDKNDDENNSDEESEESDDDDDVEIIHS